MPSLDDDLTTSQRYEAHIPDERFSCESGPYSSTVHVGANGSEY